MGGTIGWALFLLPRLAGTTLVLALFTKLCAFILGWQNGDDLAEFLFAAGVIIGALWLLVFVVREIWSQPTI